MIITLQNHGMQSFHSGISRYVPIEPSGFMMNHATKYPSAIPAAEPATATMNAYEV